MVYKSVNNQAPIYLNPNPTGGGGVFHPPHGFLIAISLCYEKLSQNSLILVFICLPHIFGKKFQNGSQMSRDNTIFGEWSMEVRFT